MCSYDPHIRIPIAYNRTFRQYKVVVFVTQVLRDNISGYNTEYHTWVKRLTANCDLYLLYIYNPIAHSNRPCIQLVSVEYFMDTRVQNHVYGEKWTLQWSEGEVLQRLYHAFQITEYTKLKNCIRHIYIYIYTCQLG